MKLFEQIFRTRAESQRIVAARPLYRLQYPVRVKWSAKDFPQHASGISMRLAAGYAPGLGRAEPIVSRVTNVGTDDPAPSMVSNLEAFSC